MRFIIVLSFLTISFLGFSQNEPSFNAYYEAEEKALRENYKEEVVENELKYLYRNWVEEIKVARNDLAKMPESEERNGQIKALNNKQEMLQAYISGEDFIPEEEPEEVAEEIIQEEPREEPEMVEDKEPEPVSEPEPEPVQEAEPLEETTQIEPKVEPVAETTNVSPNQASLLELYSSEIEGVYYRIQVAATGTQKSGKDVQAILGLQEEVMEEQHNGLYKYLVGKFSIYNSAKAKADELKKATGVNAFVVGYKNEQRASFSEIFEMP